MAYDKKYEYKPFADSGTLRSSKVKKGAKSPDYFGDLAIDLKDLEGVQTIDGLTCIRLSGWKKMDKSGNTFLSLSVNRFTPEDAPKPKRQHDDDDIPF
jgi:hypothetical protein